MIWRLQKSKMPAITTKETVYMIARIFYLLFVTGMILMILALDVSREVNAGEIEINTLVKKALYSCFAYEDVRERPLIIDVKKFNTKTFDECIRLSRFSAEFALTYGDKTLSVYNNEKVHLVNKRLCDFKNYECLNYEKNILVYEEGFQKGKLKINAVLQNA
ncbi:MAG: hypothetical protein Q8R00_03645 [Candidatus Nanoarchaeia archaeon]|nr:hypothetical protein [Candidatus Nanoarchaeia archaeon]